MSDDFLRRTGVAPGAKFDNNGGIVVDPGPY